MARLVASLDQVPEVILGIGSQGVMQRSTKALKTGGYCVYLPTDFYNLIYFLQIFLCFLRRNPFCSQTEKSSALITFIHSFHKLLLRTYLIHGQHSGRWGSHLSPHPAETPVVNIHQPQPSSQGPGFCKQTVHGQVNLSPVPFWGLFQYPNSIRRLIIKEAHLG